METAPEYTIISSRDSGNEVKLNYSEILQASHVGRMRQIAAMKKHFSNAYGTDDNDWQNHIEGALGEFAVAKYFGLFWSGTVGKLRLPDVGPLEVRTTPGDSYNLILHDKDKDDRPYILVTGKNGTYRLRGWVWGYEGKDRKFWGDPTKTNRPAYFVPRINLRDILELRKYLHGNRNNPPRELE